MNIYVKSSIIALIALLFCLSPIFQVFGRQSIQLGLTWGVPPEEEIVDGQIAGMINIWSIMAGYNTNNFFGEMTTVVNIYSAAWGLGESNSIAFYVGHGHSDYMFNWIFWEQQWYICDNSGNKAYDKNIYSFWSGTDRNVDFAFLWACEQGDTKGGTHWSGTPYGMATAWLHGTPSSDDGYAQPDGGGKIWIGIKGAAFGLSDNLILGYMVGYRFLYAFYFAALCDGATYSIKAALDFAAFCVWGSPSYSDCSLYKGYWWTEWQQGRLVNMTGQMVTYGDGNMHISSLT